LLRVAAGRSAQEREFGADILIHVRFDGRDFKYDKGVLVQAKMLEVGTLIDVHELLRLREQCEKMLDHSLESFVWIYSCMGLHCDTAQNVLNVNGRNLVDQRDLNDQRL
jgi:hypothetical protein